MQPWSQFGVDLARNLVNLRRRFTHQALLELAGGSLGLTLFAVTVHTAAMVLSGGTIAWVVYRYLGLGLLRRGWVNLDLLWAMLLIVVGSIALAVPILK